MTKPPIVLSLPRLRLSLVLPETSLKIGLLLAVAIILLLAFALRLRLLGEGGIWWDEGWSVWLARQEPLSIAIRTASDPHPPLHYWILHYWDRVVGESEFAVRFSSVAFALLTIALLFRFGRALGGPAMGLLAALFLALSRFHLWWSQEIRMYALAVFLALLSLYIFWALMRGGGLLLWLGYILANLAGLYTFYLSALVLLLGNLIFFLALALERGRRSLRLLLLWMLAQAVILGLFLPWAAFFMGRAVRFERVEASLFDLGLFLRLYATVLPLGVTTDIEGYTAQMLGFLILALAGGAGLWVQGKRGWEASSLILLPLLTLPVAVYLLSLAQGGIYDPKVEPRYLILFLPVYFLLLSQGIAFLWRRSTLLGLASLLLPLFTLAPPLQGYFEERYGDQDTPALAQFLRAYAQEGEAIVLNPDKQWPVFAYYLGEGLPLYGIPYRARMSGEEAQHWLEPVFSRHPKAWLITTEETLESDPQGEIEGWLRSQGEEVVSRAYGRKRVLLFRWGADGGGMALKEKGVLAGPGRELGQLRLLGFERFSRRLRTGDTLYLASRWQGEGKYGVRLLLLDEGGRVVLSRTAGGLDHVTSSPEGSSFRVENRLPISSLVPSGRYRLQMQLEAASGDSFSLPVGEVSVHRPKAASIQAEPMERLSMDLGGRVRLLGYDLSSRQLRHGEGLAVSLYWEALKEMETSYTVFLHLLDGSGRVVAQRDGLPKGGAYPTTAWAVGETVQDSYQLPLDLPPGDYRIEVGMYEASRGLRLPILDEEGYPKGEDRILLGPVRVIEP